MIMFQDVPGMMESVSWTLLIPVQLCSSAAVFCLAEKEGGQGKQVFLHSIHRPFNEMTG